MIKKLILALSIIPLIYSCKKESNEITQTETTQNATLNDSTISQSSKLSVESVPAGSYDVTKSLPKGYVKTGTVDYTAYIQSAINSNTNLTFPAFPILVNDKGISIPSNRTITFLTGSQLLLKPSSNSNYNILRIDHGSNIVLNYPVIIGDSRNHKGTSGEWGQGIGIYSSSNITVNGANVSYCWGDGIYLSTSNGTVTNTNIKITNAYLKYNRRDGMSIISVNGLVLEAPYAAYSTGTSPMCGINFEPAKSTDELQNITVNNPQTGYNAGKGIQISYSNLYGGANKKTSITINNAADKRSDVAFKASAMISKRTGSETITGTLAINNPYWRLNPNTPLVASLYENNIRLTIVKPVIQDADGVSLSQSAMLSLLTYKTHMLYGSNYSIKF
ncbi:MAG: right-handed parallel beta-helix repeat-containing protein [Mucilaginibacter sp.]|nr:right-handed parallel beta-helix repeat-containing protein [Mucilaginibacter sp.]